MTLWFPLSVVFLSACGLAGQELPPEEPGVRRLEARVENLRPVRQGSARKTQSVGPGPDENGFAERPTRFSSQGSEIEGTLCLPVKRSGQLPLIVLVSGSALDEQEEKIGADFAFRDLAHGLAVVGIGTLRFDKRSFAFSAAIDPKRWTLDWLITNDARAALEYGATIPEVDGTAIFILGHSLGGTMAPYIAQRFPRTRGIILMAAAVVRIDEALARRKRLALETQGKSEQEIREALASQTQIFADIRAGKTPPTRMINGAPARYWLDWMNRDTAGELKKSNLPVLVLGVGRDALVGEADYDKLRKTLSSKAPEKIEFHWFPELNHWFQKAALKTPLDSSPAGHIDRGVIDTIARWVTKQAAAK